MLSKFRRVSTLTLVAALTALAGQGVQADDTEIFVAEPPEGTNTAANIMFIIDTSGSMDGDVETQADWDPDTNFDGDCRSDRIYWAAGADQAPSCSGWSSTGDYVDEDNFLCQTALEDLEADGNVTLSNVTQWRSPTRRRSGLWEGLLSDRDSEVECKADTEASPAHGRSSGDGQYPTDGSSGPYTSTTPSDSWWTTNDRNETYTFYTGNYLNYLRSGGTVIKTRLEIVQQVAIDTLDRLSNVNVGLMRFNNSQGGRVLVPITPIETAREDLKREISELTPSGWTPLSETLFEAYRYWSGGMPRWDDIIPPSVASARTSEDGPFQSPLTEESCSGNYNILLTDGEPTEDTAVNAEVPNLTGFVGTDAAAPTQCSDNSTGGSNGRCLDDVAKYMYDNDMYTDSDAKNNVITYTVGFGEDVAGSTTLAATAAAGHGTAFEASDTASLSDVFTTILRDIEDDEVSFTAPAVSVNAFNRTQNLNDLFITVFKPAGQLHWPGNLKKYRLTDDGAVVDANGANAVDPDTGYFEDAAQSYWSDVVDGKTVELGGAAHRLPDPADRNVYTDLEALTADAPADLAGVEGNVISTDNTQIANDPALIGLPSDATEEDVNDLIQWIRGGDIDGADDTVARHVMGDPLHARPVSVIYGGSEGTADITDAVVYAATNDGFLHAVHPNGVSGSIEAGEELWSFIPSELLPRMADLYDDPATSDKGYGLDGNLVAYKQDDNNDGIVGAGDKVYLFFGMGRGGYNYYALDITDKDDPKFLWRQGRDADMVGLGQTWSTPVPTQVRIGSETKLVLIVGGGYDVSQDAVPYSTDSSGNRLFILDALTGDVLWHAGPTNVAGLGYDADADFKHAKLTNSIPADIRVLDMNNDGLADRMYAADTGGRVWRFDIHNGSSGAELVTGGVFASLGNADEGTHTTASSRRFYNAPDVSMLRVNGSFVLNIAIGSGYRGHPLNTEIQDRFYSLRDTQPFVALTQDTYDEMVAITDDDEDLIDVTDDATPTIPDGAKGWKILLNSPSWQGEKVLTEARTFGGAILFSSFTPVPSENVDLACTVSGVKNTLYVINALDGSPHIDRDGDSTAEVSDRSGDLQQGGIAPTVVVLFPSPDDPENCEGTECAPPPVCLVGVEGCGVELTNNPQRTFWTQQDADAEIE